MGNSTDTIRSPAQAQWVAVVAVFGAVWGAAEISLGAILRNVSIPMHGTLMAGIGVVIMLVARQTLSVGDRRGRGVCLAIGVVAATILPMYATRGLLWAMLGVVTEAACLEAILWPGRPGRRRFFIASAVATLVPLVHLLTALTVQYGPAALSEFRELMLAKQGGSELGFVGQTAGTLLALIAVASAAYGLFCGTLAWSLAGQILKRLGRAPARSRP
jgi:hypothetical protein